MVILETERLILRELTEEDIPLLTPIMSDGETMQYYPMTFDAPYIRKWLANSMGSYRKNGFGRWGVIVKESGTLIGDAGITYHTLDGEELPELGYRLCRAYWRQGYGGEAARAIRDWAFRNTELPAIYSFMMTANIASAATAESCGMRLYKHYMDEINGDTFLYTLTREEWERRFAGGDAPSA